MKTVSESTELASNPEVQAIAPLSAPSPIEMMQAMIKGGVTENNVAAFEKLAELQWKFEARDAEKTFAAAFGGLQGKLKNVKATHSVNTKQGDLKFKVAKFEDLWDQLKPLFEEFQFTAGFVQKYEEGMPLRVTQVFILQHVPSGHKTETPFTVRVGSGPPGASEFQADGAASSYAKMRSVCSCLNIIIEQAIGDDASAIGDINTKISKAQADELERRCKELNTDIQKFLDLPGVKTFAEIPAANYRMLDKFLSIKEKAAR